MQVNWITNGDLPYFFSFRKTFSLESLLDLPSLLDSLLVLPWSSGLVTQSGTLTWPLAVAAISENPERSPY